MSLKDILKVVAGMVLYAADSLLMERLRCWTYKEIFLDGSVPDISWKIARRPDCTLCGVPQDEPQPPIALGQVEGRL